MYGDVTEDELVHLPVLIERVNNEIKVHTLSLFHSSTYLLMKSLGYKYYKLEVQ
jgi:hypothetical protein